MVFKVRFFICLKKGILMENVKQYEWAWKIEMQNYFPWIFLSNLIVALLTTCLEEAKYHWIVRINFWWMKMKIGTTISKLDKISTLCMLYLSLFSFFSSSMYFSSQQNLKIKSQYKIYKYQLSWNSFLKLNC